MANSENALRILIVEEIILSGLSQAEICKRAEITPKHLNQYLNGHCGMSLDTIDKVLEVLCRGLVLTTQVDLGARVRTNSERNTNHEVHTPDKVAQ